MAQTRRRPEPQPPALIDDVAVVETTYQRRS